VEKSTPQNPTMIAKPDAKNLITPTTDKNCLSDQGNVPIVAIFFIAENIHQHPSSAVWKNNVPEFVKSSSSLQRMPNRISMTSSFLAYQEKVF
jgi:hypothetical protein